MHPPATFDVHVISHTHWDREWYHPLGRFRQRLVGLIDELLDDPEWARHAFLLDGQAVVLEDYLAVRPGRATALTERLRAGLLEAGPWYVLADELIPGGEALVRNLLAGRRAVRALGGEPPPVLYCPDSFGHPAALPALAAGFGLGVVIVWRGYGGARWPAGDAARWRAPSGDAAVLFHLPPDGYEYGSSLPPDDAGAAARWARMRAVLGERCRLGVLLVQNGADHHAAQPRVGEAMEALARAAAPDRVSRGSLSEFARVVRDRGAAAALPTVEGELRDSYGYAWALQGTFGTRAHQKRGNALAERLLTREAEPWSAIARARGAADRRDLLAAAWRTLLSCHPHDTLCGCSIDQVARAMDARLDEAIAQARGLRDEAMADLLGHDTVAARERRDEWRPALVVRNPAPRPRGGVVEVVLESFLADVPVGPSSAAVPPLTRIDVPPPPTVRDATGAAVPYQHLRTRLRQRRTESPRHYPDNDLVAEQAGVIWAPAVEGYGTTSFAVGAGEPGARAPATARGGRRFIENEALRVSVGADGITVLDRANGRSIEGAISLETARDSGDLYTPSIARDREMITRPAHARVLHRGPLRAELVTRWRVPVRGTTRPPPPGQGTARVTDAALTVHVHIILDAGATFARLRVRGVNRATDHRLRLVVRTAVRDPDVWADAAFGPLRRRPIVVPESEARLETPPPTAPLHRYVSLFAVDGGATVVSDGLCEYEATLAGDVAVTLVRAVGALSRNDVPERPGHAGWPVPTPGAQCAGPFAAELALALHGPRDAATVDAIERLADDALLPPRGRTLRSALALPPATPGVRLEGRGLAFAAAKPSEDGAWMVLRCVNLLDEPVAGAWRIGWPVREAMLARLDETHVAPLAPGGGKVPFMAPPRAPVTILVR
jgi:alpha-mannosidase